MLTRNKKTSVTPHEVQGTTTTTIIYNNLPSCIKALLDANIIRNIITNIFYFNVCFFEVLVIYPILELRP